MLSTCQDAIRKKAEEYEQKKYEQKTHAIISQTSSYAGTENEKIVFLMILLVLINPSQNRRKSRVTWRVLGGSLADEQQREVLLVRYDLAQNPE